MKFGKQFLEAAHPAWSDSYIDYKALKQILKQITPAFSGQLQTEGDAQLEGLFMSSLLIQIQKVSVGGGQVVRPLEGPCWCSAEGWGCCMRRAHDD